MIVYHGTDSISARNIVKNGIDLAYGNKFADNGQGFYMTESRAFAERRAKMVALSQREFQKDQDISPALLSIELEIDADSGLCIKEFPFCDADWQEFVAYNRLGEKFLANRGILNTNHNLDAKYDIVIDETADAGLSDIISKIRKYYSPSLMQELIRAVGKSNDPVWDRQISLHSRRAVKCIKSTQMIILDVNT